MIPDPLYHVITLTRSTTNVSHTFCRSVSVYNPMNRSLFFESVDHITTNAQNNPMVWTWPIKETSGRSKLCTTKEKICKDSVYIILH